MRAVRSRVYANYRYTIPIVPCKHTPKSAIISNKHACVFDYRDYRRYTIYLCLPFFGIVLRKLGEALGLMCTDAEAYFQLDRSSLRGVGNLALPEIFKLVPERNLRICAEIRKGFFTISRACARLIPGSVAMGV